MKRSIIFTLSVLACFASVAQNVREHVNAQADQPCYVVGEHLKLDVCVTLPDGNPSPSRVAYVEIADTAQVYAQAMLTLDEGCGYGEMPLPTAMHSGVYQLCVYTRGLRNFGESTFFTTPIGVINPVKLSHRDNIRFIPTNDDAITVEIDPIPSSDGIIATVPNEYPFAYEIEGHIVTAHVSANPEEIENVRLALVGKSPMIYDGRSAADGNYEFYTTGIYGDQPSFVSAYSHDGASLQTELISPYVQVLPSYLPTLVVRCSEEALKARYAEALRQVAIDERVPKDNAETRAVTFMTSTPQRTYDLDEWTSMSTVREMFTEFIRGVQISRTKGVLQLFTDPNCPALVLFDGVPIYDVQNFMNYDPHLLKYVMIYDDSYTFGQTYCHGVVSFISHSGKLPNFTLDEGTTFASYQFPQPKQ